MVGENREIGLCSSTLYQSVTNRQVTEEQNTQWKVSNYIGKSISKTGG